MISFFWCLETPLCLLYGLWMGGVEAKAEGKLEAVAVLQTEAAGDDSAGETNGQVRERFQKQE